MYITNGSGPAPYDTTRMINTSTGAYLSTGGVWTNNSDRSRKTDIEPVDEASILDKIARLDISEWRYLGESDEVRHVGPMAQDFYRAFRLGYNERSITTIDAAGVALAAIKELNRKTAVIDSLSERVTKLEEIITKLAEDRKSTPEQPQ